MLFSYEQKDLLRILLKFSHIVGTDKNLVPILSHIKVEVKNNEVIFSGTDQELFLTETVAANKGNEEGECTFPAKSLLDLVKELCPATTIRILLVDEKRLQVRQGRRRYSLPSADPKTMPKINIPVSGFTPIEPRALVEALATVDYAIYADDSRGALSGILLEPAQEEGFMRAVASDGRRLATCKVPGVLKESVVLSKKGATAIKKILPLEEEASFYVMDNYLYLTLENSVLGIRLLAGKFPNYKAAFPQGGHHLIKLERDAIIKVLKRVSLFAEDKSSGKATIKVNKEGLEVIVCTEKGEATEDVLYLSGSKISGELELQINPYHLQQSLDKFKDESVSIRIYSNLSPILIFGESNVMALVMPQKS